MNNINFDEGYKELTINGDESRVIRFNPSDFSILERLEKAIANIDEETKKIEKEDIKLNTDGSVNTDKLEQIKEYSVIINKLNTIIKEQVDYIFDSNVSDVVFGNQSPMSIVKGKPLFERFFEAITPFLKDEIIKEQKAREKVINKYTEGI